MVKLYFKEFPKPEYEPALIQPNWECAPIGYSQTSGALECANFDHMENELDKLDPYGDTWEIAFFPHFSCGWLGNIFVKPDSAAAKLCDELRIKMANYPCLNEDLWVEYEAESNAKPETKPETKPQHIQPSHSAYD